MEDHFLFCSRCNKEKPLNEFSSYSIRHFSCLACNRKTNRKYKLKRRFRMSLDEYNELLLKQNGVCAICGGVNKDGTRLNVDHNHLNDKVRELLCKNCNFMIALARESREFLRNAIIYLNRHNGTQEFDEECSPG